MLDAVVLAYHKVDARREAGITRVSPAAFRDGLDALLAAGWLPGDPEGPEWRLAPRVDGLRLAPRVDGTMAAASPPAGRFVVTFDDGYAGFLDHALPALLERGIRPLLFPIVGWVGRSNGWDHPIFRRPFPHLGWEGLAEALRRGVRVGSHGWGHWDLRRVSPDALHRELLGSRRALEDRLGAGVESFSYPYGRVGLREREACAQAGYRRAFALGPSGRPGDPWRIPRLPVHAATSPAGLPLRASAFARAGRGAPVDRFISWCSGGTPWLLQGVLGRGVEAPAARSPAPAP